MKRASATARESKYESLDTERKAIIDYLHGCISGGTERALAAARYEYARESKVLRDLASAHTERCRINDEGRFTKLLEGVQSRYGHKPVSSPWNLLWRMLYFPALPWNGLSAECQRDLITLLDAPETRTKEPLPIVSVAAIRGHGGYAAQAQKMWKEAYTQGNSDPPPAIFRKEHGRVVAVFELDFTKTKSHLISCFEAWLSSDENRAALDAVRHEAASRESRLSREPADALKHLAVRRLLQLPEINGKWLRANRWAVGHHIPGKPFHRAKGDQTGKAVREDPAILSLHPSFYSEAKGAANEFQKRLFPWEQKKQNSTLVETLTKNLWM